MDGTFNLFIYSYWISWGSMITKYDEFLPPTMAQKEWLDHFTSIFFGMSSATYPEKTRIMASIPIWQRKLQLPPYNSLKIPNISICLFFEKNAIISMWPKIPTSSPLFNESNSWNACCRSSTDLRRLFTTCLIGKSWNINKNTWRNSIKIPEANGLPLIFQWLEDEHFLVY